MWLAREEALQKVEDMTFADAEIDAFLPKALKRDRPQMSFEFFALFLVR
jgi:hypothetical protein